jgi:osmotically-inducible protein OsmY
MTSTENILRTIHAALGQEPAIDLERFPVHASFAEGDVVLEAEVENVAAKKLTLELVGSVPGVDRIVDRLRVSPAERMPDARERELVCNTLLEEPALINCTIGAGTLEHIDVFREPTSERSGEITVQVENGVVTLDGQVPSLSHKRLAGVLAWWVPGTRDVINGLEETPPQEDNDDEVTDAVLLVLEKDPFVNASEIRVSTRNRLVTLEGLVPKPEHRQMAESDAWYIFGVDRVINRLVVRALT